MKSITPYIGEGVRVTLGTVEGILGYMTREPLNREEYGDYLSEVRKFQDLVKKLKYEQDHPILTPSESLKGLYDEASNRGLRFDYVLFFTDGYHEEVITRKAEIKVKEKVYEEANKKANKEAKIKAEGIWFEYRRKKYIKEYTKNYIEEYNEKHIEEYTEKYIDQYTLEIIKEYADTYSSRLNTIFYLKPMAPEKEHFDRYIRLLDFKNFIPLDKEYHLPKYSEYFDILKEIEE